MPFSLQKEIHKNMCKHLLWSPDGPHTAQTHSTAQYGDLCTADTSLNMPVQHSVPTLPCSSLFCHCFTCNQHFQHALPFCPYSLSKLNPAVADMDPLQSSHFTDLQQLLGATTSMSEIQPAFECAASMPHGAQPDQAAGSNDNLLPWRYSPTKRRQAQRTVLPAVKIQDTLACTFVGGAANGVNEDTSNWQVNPSTTQSFDGTVPDVQIQHIVDHVLNKLRQRNPYEASANRGNRSHRSHYATELVSREEARIALSKPMPMNFVKSFLSSVYTRYVDFEMMKFGPRPSIENHAQVKEYRKKKNSISSTASCHKKSCGISLMKLMVDELVPQILELASRAENAAELLAQDNLMTSTLSQTSQVGVGSDSEPFLQGIYSASTQLHDTTPGLSSFSSEDICLSFLTDDKITDLQSHGFAMDDIFPVSVDTAGDLASLLLLPEDQNMSWDAAALIPTVSLGKALKDLALHARNECGCNIHAQVHLKASQEAEIARREKATEKFEAADKDVSFSLEDECQGLSRLNVIEEFYVSHARGVRKAPVRSQSRRKAQNCATAHRNNRYQKARFESYYSILDNLCSLRNCLEQALRSYTDQLAGLEVKQHSSKRCFATAAC